ncbi:fluoride efflux transporter CrcB [Bacillus sp. FJAT-29790]|uniref:fluoride efflux transporter CrcB n=1 Tax=Bacillus sp. FJAT-29790 TaxID=1895002 RepID=UPI001C2150F1|nr:fluoride efflux transporter CrcB [Bacillus sp. FJAT-29790]MBU8878343.1 fluoride efflux transporter CrcB [Bacillus sp. FJAT-29790]
MTYVFIGVGGIVGSLLRYFTSVLSVQLWGNQFPFGTLFVNILGAFLLGIFTCRVSQKGNLSPNLVLAIGTGAIGSFTTLSTLSIETVSLIESGAFFSAFLYLLLSMAGGISAAFIGYRWKREKKYG